MRLTWSSCRTRPKGSPRRRLAPLEPRQALGEPARRDQSAEIARVERRGPFGKGGQPHPPVRRGAPPPLGKKTHPPSPRPTAPRPPGFRAVEHTAGAAGPP